MTDDLHRDPGDETDEYDPLEDDTLDHLAGAPPPSNRGERHGEARLRTLRMIRANGSNPATASPALISAAITHFGSWEVACVRAGVATRPLVI
jgi:hypothetical protein